MVKKSKQVLKKEDKGISPKEYAKVLLHIKKQISEAQIRANFAVNKELIKLYWFVGKTISEKQKVDGWGSKIIEKLVHDIQNEFPGISGFSRANIFRMRAFYAAYEKVAQVARQLEDLPIFNIPWFHNVILIQKVKTMKGRIWYAEKTVENGWSRTMLEHWIKSGLFKREGKAVTNFHARLPAPHSDMAQQSLKDPYIFDFLTLKDDHIEKDLEQGLIDHVQKFLLELGEGFSFVARQKHLEVDDVDYYIDLLFYHLKLRCYVVVELKSTPFKPEHAGQINFYLSAVDDLLRHPDDKPTIGLLLCKSKKNFTVEYALRRNASPIGVASYETKILETLPKDLKGSLPTVEEFEAEFEKSELLQVKKAETVKKKTTKTTKKSAVKRKVQTKK